jgi:hypothetical protein
MLELGLTLFEDALAVWRTFLADLLPNKWRQQSHTLKTQAFDGLRKITRRLLQQFSLLRHPNIRAGRRGLPTLTG